MSNMSNWENITKKKLERSKLEWVGKRKIHLVVVKAALYIFLNDKESQGHTYKKNTHVARDEKSSRFKQGRM